VREQTAGVEDPECSLAFVKFCTHLSLLLFAAAVWWLQKDSVRSPLFFQTIEFNWLQKNQTESRFMFYSWLNVSDVIFLLNLAV
jgi:hypothetical protein